MHSSGTMSARRTSMARPDRSPSSPTPSTAPAISDGSEVTIAFSTTSATSSHQNAVIAVRTRPFCGIGSANTTSKALIRSDATINSASVPAS